MNVLSNELFPFWLLVRANDGDAYPLGALPIGTKVHCVEQTPGFTYHKIRAAGTYGIIMVILIILLIFHDSNFNILLFLLQRKFDGHVVIQDMRKHELAFSETCMATVGRVSNAEHQDVKLGSHSKNRELGNRPRSGLWQRKTGRFGRKIKPLPKMRYVSGMRASEIEQLVLTMDPHMDPVPIYGNAF